MDNALSAKGKFGLPLRPNLDSTYMWFLNFVLRYSLALSFKEKNIPPYSSFLVWM